MLRQTILLSSRTLHLSTRCGVLQHTPLHYLPSRQLGLPRPPHALKSSFSRWFSGPEAQPSPDTPPTPPDPAVAATAATTPVAADAKSEAKTPETTPSDQNQADSKAAKSAEAFKEAAAQKKQPLSPLDDLKQQLEKKDAEAREWKDRCLREVAEARNIQARAVRDQKVARDFAIQKFAKDLVDTVDNLDRALTTVPKAHVAPSPPPSSTPPASESAPIASAVEAATAPKEANSPSSPSAETGAAAEAAEGSSQPDYQQDLINLYDGLCMTERILMSTLKKHGLERFNPLGQKFDPSEHEATFMTPQEGKDDNTVFFVQQKGFRLNGRVIRPAKVGVVKNK